MGCEVQRLGRLVQGDPGPQPGDGLKKAGPAPQAPAGWLQVQGQEQQRIELLLRQERSRHHSQDPERVRVDQDFPANDVATSLEPVQPKPVAQDHGVVPVRGWKRAAQLRRHAEHLKIGLGDDQADRAAGFALARHDDRYVFRDGGCLQRRVLLLPLQEHPRRDRELRVFGGQAFIDADEPARVRVGQGPQDDGVHDAEDRCAGAEAQCEGHDGGGGEAGLAAQQANPVAEVAEQGFQPWQAPQVAALFLDALDVAEQALRRLAGFVRAHALGEVPLGQGGKMLPDLLAHFRLPRRPSPGEAGA